MTKEVGRELNNLSFPKMAFLEGPRGGENYYSKNSRNADFFVFS